ncbi:hypothetical protein [Streptomyces sp. NPDC059909]|uniref:hypothetical protein n=1 Tax=Streptomyces sp. NPDC059909 TaxID=3346998 RepID=UPI003658F1DD
MAARLLLVVALALGVFVMHTVGHPGEGSGMTSDSHVADSGGVPAYGHRAAAVTEAGPPPAMAVAVPKTSTATDSHAGHGPAPTGATAPADDPGMAMDMASLCVAVLGTWALAALLHAVFVRRRDWLARLADGVLAVARANPPPRAPDLAKLSILRI